MAKKNQANSTQYPEGWPFAIKNYFLSSFLLSSNVIGDILKKQVPLIKWGYMINDNENKAENEK